jgi:hypothetical protein
MLLTPEVLGEEADNILECRSQAKKLNSKHETQVRVRQSECQEKLTVVSRKVRVTVV